MKRGEIRTGVGEMGIGRDSDGVGIQCCFDQSVRHGAMFYATDLSNNVWRS